MCFIKKLPTIAILFLIFALNNSFAQIKSITGTVIDSVSKEKLPGVNILLIEKKDGKVYSGMASDQNGKFIFKNIKEKNLSLKLSMIGYQTKNIDKLEAKSNLEFGQILLSPSAVMLNSVEVKGQRQMIEYQSDKTIINIDKVPGNNSSVSDALKNTGLVDVDPSTKKISIRGSNAVNIKIDGKPLTMAADELLSQMPASYVDKVEISTVPSAKDDPEGEGGIINIITKKNASDNYNGSVNLYGSTQHMGFGSAMFNYKKNSFNFSSALLGYLGEMNVTNNSDRINYNSNSLYYINNKGESSTHGNMKGVRISMDYDLDTVNTISVSGSYYKMDYNNENTAFADNFSSSYFDVYNYVQKNNGDYNNNFINYSAYYRNKINNKGCELTSDIYFMKQDNKNNSDMNTDYNYMVLYPTLQNNNRNDVNKTIIFKLDYVNPTENSGKFEAGYWLTYRNRQNDYRNTNYSYLQSIWNDSLGLSNIFKYREIIHSSYLTYSNKVYIFDAKAGLRLEQTLVEGNQEMTNQIFDNDYLSLFPSLSISYKITDKYQISFNAARRISRPQMDQINPFVIVYGPNNIFRGNSQIGPTYTNIYELALSSYLKFYFSDTKGKATYFSTIEQDSVSVNTYINSKSSKTYGTELNYPIMNDPSSFIKLPAWLTMVNISLSYYHLTEEAGYLNDNYIINRNVYRITSNVNCKLWYDITASMYITYTPRIKDSRFITYSTTYLGVYLNKDLLNRKLQIGFNIGDILNASHTQSETMTSDFYSYSNNQYKYSPSVALSIRYNFNDFKMKNERNVDDGRDKNEGGIF